MKKILITNIILLFLATMSSFAASSETNKTGSQYGTLFENSSTVSTEENYNGGLFNAPASGPGNRPGSGDGIGQDPVGDGLCVLVGCSIVFGIIKVIDKRRKIEL